jgi:hypothetical protein
MTLRPHEPGRLEEGVLTVGLGLVLLGVVAMGVFETLVGTAHVSEHVPGLGVIVIHTSVSPELRAYTAAAGLVVLLVWGLSRVVVAVAAGRGPDPNK